MVIGFLTFGLAALVFVNAVAITHEVWIFAVLFALSGFPNVTASVGMRSVSQRVCPPEILGRLSGLMGAAGAVGAGLGAVAAALLIDQISVLVLFNVQGQVFTLCGVIAYFFVLRKVVTRPLTDS
jgi:MFS family permease